MLGCQATAGGGGQGGRGVSSDPQKDGLFVD